MRANVLLTGGAGYIGSHTYVALLKAGYQPIIFDNYSNADLDTPARLAQLTGEPTRSVRGDILSIADLSSVFEQFQIDAVVHFAAFKAVGQSVSNPLSYIKNNNVGLINLLDAMVNGRCKTLVFSSSATVYGDPHSLPIHEDAPLSFTNPYGYTKLAGEQILTQVAQAQEGWATSILRYFNPAGAHRSGLLRQSPKDTTQPPENLMPRLLDVAHGNRPHLKVFGNDWETPDGTGVRDYIHVDDLARGHVLSLDNLFKTRESHIVNLGTGQGYSVLEMISAFKKASGREIPYEFVDRRLGDIGSCYADVSRAKKLLGFEAALSLDDMCVSDWAVER